LHLPEDLQAALKEADERPGDLLILGNGSDTLVKDGGFRGTVIKLGDSFANIEVDGTKLICGSAALLSQAAKVALDIFREYDTHITVRHRGECFVDEAQKSDTAYTYYNIWLPHVNVLNAFSVGLSDFYERIYSFPEIEMAAVFFHLQSEMDECRDRLARIQGISVVEVAPFNLEIFSDRAGKGNALISLAEKLGIEKTATISVGDSENDSSMLKAAELGLAVRNSTDKALSVCDEVICSNDEHAIAYIFSHYFE